MVLLLWWLRTLRGRGDSGLDDTVHDAFQLPGAFHEWLKTQTSTRVAEATGEVRHGRQQIGRPAFAQALRRGTRLRATITGYDGNLLIVNRYRRPLSSAGKSRLTTTATTTDDECPEVPWS